MPSGINLQIHEYSGFDLSSLQKSFGGLKISVSMFRWLGLLSFFSYSAIWTTGYLRTLLFIVFASLGFLVIRGRSISFLKPLSQLISVAALVYTIWARTGPAPGVTILLNFAGIILILQMLVLDDARSAAGVLVLSMMIILAVAAMNVNFIFPMILIPYLMTFYRILREFALTRHQEISRNLSVQQSCSTFFRKLTSGALVCIVFSFIWLVIFYLIPRNESFGVASEVSRRRLKGFSETLSIVESGLLEDNPAVIMRIIPTEEKTFSVSILRRMKNKLLRGATFATYRNGSWERGTKRRWHIDTRRNDGEVKLGNSELSFRELHQFEIFLENTDPPVVFIPDNSYLLHVSTSYLAVEDDGSLFFFNRIPGNRRYRVELLPDPVEPDESKVSDIQPSRDLALYSSTRGIPEKITSLAVNLASGTDIIRERVERTIQYLQKNCQYSLYQLPSNIDPVEDFLFESRSGTCEHFATSMSLLLRAMGIPARPVGGYTMGDWNEIGGFFTVRQRHAHTWVEVFFPNTGWIPFDPTPVSSEETVESEISRLFTAMWETYEGYWFSYVYNFDNKAQMIGFRKIYSGLLSRFSDTVLLLFRVETIFIIALIFVIFRKKLKIIIKKKGKTDAWIPDWYLEWEAGLSVRRELWETPGEFHSRLFSKKLISADEFAYLQSIADEINCVAFAADKGISANNHNSEILEKIKV